MPPSQTIQPTTTSHIKTSWLTSIANIAVKNTHPFQRSPPDVVTDTRTARTQADILFMKAMKNQNTPANIAGHSIPVFPH
jgi:hypothetical protein